MIIDLNNFFHILLPMNFLTELLQFALEEDCVTEDVTSLACIPENDQAVGELVLKQDGVIAGLPFLGKIFRFEAFAKDGQACKKGMMLGRATGSARELLGKERTALNLLQHLSGIATLTARCVALAGGCKILDTRKTLPGYRELQKYAVRCGGGTNHRMHLGERILIKNNHLALVKDAIGKCKGREFEVEVGSFEELQAALELGAKAVLLDNMSVKEVQRCVEFAKGKAFLEASGGITLEKIADYAKTGVDGISMGALTHSAPALDIAFRIRSV